MINHRHENKCEIKKFDLTKGLTKREQNEVNKVYKLRYSVYVDELNYDESTADYETKMQKDPLDGTGRLFGFFKNNEAVGTVLTNYAKDSDLGYYPELYKMHEYNYGSYFDSSISTKLIVRKDYRSSSIAFRLACATYVQALNDGIMYDFVDCKLEMVPFYIRLGYKVYQKSMYHPEYGDGAVVVLELQNIDHLEKSESLFAKYYRKVMGTKSIAC